MSVFLLLRSLSALLAPVSILDSKRDVVQEFYMYFAQEVYKWDLAQYFTPTEVVDFIVSLVNPQGGDLVKDPACGSGDFLVSAMHHASKEADISDAVWGADNSSKAVQISVLNMVLNGDGKSNIVQEDSLENVAREENTHSVMLCNPPFGVSIVENRFDVLNLFYLGKEWHESSKGLGPNGVTLESQEIGILFAELCVRQARPGGRIGIILPNGYLGNRTTRYAALREWLLRNCRLVAVVAFP
jgi:type I restriction enzyme M protein